MISNEEILLKSIVKGTVSVIRGITDTAKEKSLNYVQKNVHNLKFLLKENDINNIIKKFIIDGAVEINGKTIYNSNNLYSESYSPVKIVGSKEDWNRL